MTDVETTIEVRDLHKSYGSFQALKGITFSVNRGEIVGFLGPNGAGKSTTMKILTCFMSASSGQAKVVGVDVFEDPLAVRERVGYLPESVPLYEEMLVFDYLQFICEVRGTDKKSIPEVIRMCGLDPVAGRAIGELSKGYRQRVGLAQAIIHRPDVLILDEPTSGLDPNQIAEIRDVIREIGREKSVLLSTHVMQEIEALCDRIIVIASGKIVADGTVEQLYAKHPNAGNLEELFRMLTSDYKPKAKAAKPKRETTEPADPKRFMPTGERATIPGDAEPPSDAEPDNQTNDEDEEES